MINMSSLIGYQNGVGIDVRSRSPFLTTSSSWVTWESSGRKDVYKVSVEITDEKNENGKSNLPIMDTADKIQAALKKALG